MHHLTAGNSAQGLPDFTLKGGACRCRRQRLNDAEIAGEVGVEREPLPHEVALDAAAQTAQDLAKAKRIPDVSAGFFASREMQDVTPANRERTGFLGFRISIPLPFWNRNQGEIAEKTAAAERARLESEALALQINGEAGTARQEMETNASIVRETRDSLLPLAMQQTAEMQKAYEAGQADLLSVLRAREQRLQLESAALNAERDFHLARIRYEAATGAYLP